MRRLPRAAVATVAVTLGMLLVVSSGAAAFSTSLDVVVVLDKPAYRAGDSVNATLYVMDGGVLADADGVSILVTLENTVSWTESVPVVRTATGTYRGTFPVLANMTAPFFSVLLLQARATRGSYTDSAFVWISVAPLFRVWMDLSLSTYTASPGQSVSGTIRTYVNGQLDDADSVNVSTTMDIVNLLVPEHTYPLATHLGTGTYGFSYQVPTSVNESRTVFFWGSATFSRGTSTFGANDYVALRIGVANPFVVWYHQLALTGSYADVDVWVADRAANPVSGATIVLSTLNLDYPAGPPILSFRLTTDLQGAASFNITLNYTVPPLYFGFWGNVSLGTASQSFIGVLSPPRPTYPVYAGVRRDNVFDLFEPGETAVVNYTAFDAGAPLPALPILYDVHTPTALIAFGNVTTDASGNFSLRFLMPNGTATIDFSLRMPGNTWQQRSDSISSAMRLEAVHGPFQTGRTTRVTAQLPETGAPWLVGVGLYPYNLSEYPDVRPDWSSSLELTVLFPFESSTFPYLHQFFIVNGSSFDLSLTLPVFLPRDRDYLLEIEAVPRTPNVMNGMSLGPYVLFELVRVTGTLPQPNGFLSEILPLVLVGTAAAVAVVVLLLFARRRRGPSAGSPPASQTPHTVPAAKPPEGRPGR